MKVLIYSDLFGGNTTTFIYNEVIQLSRMYDVKYICIERKNANIFPFKNLVQLPYKVNKIRKKLRWWLEIYDKKLSFRNQNFAQELEREIEEFNPDVIHCHFGYEALRFYDNLNEKHRKIPMIVSFRGYDASQFLNRKTYIDKINELLKEKNIFCTFVCDFLRQNLIRCGIQVDRSLILHSGTKTDFFKKGEIILDESKFVFLQISSYQPYKGHYYTVKAFKKVIGKIKNKEALLVFAGDGPTLNKIKELVKSEGIQEYVKFIGWVNHQEALKLLNNCNVFLQHSVTANGSTEGIPNSLMEAMALEIPVLSTYHAGIPELVADGINGFLVPERDIEQYANKMIEISSWPNRIAINREKIIQEFEFSIHMKKLADFYDLAIREQKKPKEE